MAGSVTAASVSTASAAEGHLQQPAWRHATSVAPASFATASNVPPSGGSHSWELVILDSVPPHATETGGTAVGDIDGDGKTEVIIAADGALLWYRPSEAEKGVIAQGKFAVGVAVEDIDGDGQKEVITGKRIGASPQPTEKWALYWYKPGANLHEAWVEHVLDPETTGHPHDILFGDVDGDGRRELVANAMYSDHPGLFVYKIPADPARPWKKQAVQEGISAEGTAVGDLDGDGKEEIVSGPYWYSAPHTGAFSGQPWTTHSLAPDYRELCRAAIVDVNGDGHLDVVLVEDEYPDGRLAWFENRLRATPEHPWVERPMDAALNFSHSLRVWRDAKTNRVQVLAAEMNAGGWENPYNWEARLIRYTTADGGTSWQREILYQGEGTHELVYGDLDDSGKHVIFGHSTQIIAKGGAYTGWVQMFRPLEKPSPLDQYQHMFIDRQKPYTGIDINAFDIDGDGLLDIVCGAWWYKNPTWERHPIPSVAQIINAYDVDNDGKKELIGIKPKSGANNFYSALSSELVWLKPTDLSKDQWEEHAIGTGDGDWPHGNALGALLPGGRAALVCGYHDHAHNPPQIFEIPDDPKQPWPKRVIADIPYGEELLAYDLDGDGKLDIVAGPYWLENLGDGRFEPHLLIDPQYLQSANLAAICRTAIWDVDGDGRPDILFTVEDVDYNVHKAFWAPVGWLENTGSPRDKKFNVHIIDRIRSPHSISVADLDGDGRMEVVVGEHDPFKPYRSKSRLYVYKQADAKGIVWSRFPLDNRFEHHDGAKVVELRLGDPAIISHGWADSDYVHLWERRKA
jgi:hypothetical protein